MGFAVIPIIFAISEDAFSNVPKNLIAGSLALGANRWETVTRVVLPSASPGIFSAIMVGFGRAVGETMIVLMATGNTPIMDWNPFNGFRTLSANIAVEIPEAPQYGSLYRVLFLAALAPLHRHLLGQHCGGAGAYPAAQEISGDVMAARSHQQSRDAFGRSDDLALRRRAGVQRDLLILGLLLLLGDQRSWGSSGRRTCCGCVQESTRRSSSASSTSEQVYWEDASRSDRLRSQHPDPPEGRES